MSCYNRNLAPKPVTGKQAARPAAEKRWRRADLPVDASS